MNRSSYGPDLITTSYYCTYTKEILQVQEYEYSKNTPSPEQDSVTESTSHET